MEFLGPDELAVLPVDQLTGYAYHVTERAKDAEARAQQAESKNQQVDARNQRLEGELLTRDLLTACKEAGVFNPKTLADQLRNRGAKRDDKGQAAVPDSHGVLQPAERYIAGLRDTEMNWFPDLMKGPPPPTTPDGRIDPGALAKQGTGDYIRVRQERGVAALGLRPNKFGQSR
jgi:hypothetical protein